MKTNDFIFCFDSPKSLRRAIYPEYKANRKPQTDEEKKTKKQFYHQMDLLREEILPEMGFKNILLAEGYESDDIIAKLCLDYIEKITIVANDSDLFQCLSANVSMYYASRKRFFSRKDFIARYGIDVHLWSQIKAIAGCRTDNVKGIVGVGEKTAVRYLKDELKHKSVLYRKIRNSKAIIDRNLELVTLPFKNITSFPLSENKFSKKGFLHICEKYGMESFITNMFPQWNVFFSSKPQKKKLMGKTLKK